MKWLLAVLVAVLTAGLAAAQAPPPAPTLAERDVLLLTVLQQQVEIATLRLQRAVADLKHPGWRVDLVNGQWTYVPVPAPDGGP